jgi:hypothetical protein
MAGIKNRRIAVLARRRRTIELTKPVKALREAGAQV